MQNVVMFIHDVTQTINFYEISGLNIESENETHNNETPIFFCYSLNVSKILYLI